MASLDDVLAAQRATYKAIGQLKKDLIAHVDKRHNELLEELKKRGQYIEGTVEKTGAKVTEDVLTRFNYTETAIEAVIGDEQFNKAIEKNLDKAIEEIGNDGK